MKNQITKLTMLLMALLMSVNVAWADAVPETDYFWAKLTAKPASTTTGSGKVFVDESSTTPAESEYQAVSSSAEGYSEIFLMSSLISTDVKFYAFPKANAGSYFTGWSFTEGYTDLGTGNGTYLSIGVMPSSKKGIANEREHIIYAAFEPVKLVSYEVTGSNTTVNGTCTQTVTFRAETPDAWDLSSAEGTRHFKLPTITPKTGTTGTWTTSVSSWVLNTNITMNGDYSIITVPVTFTAPNANAGEYGATLTLETYAGVKMNVYLSARTVVAGEQAIRYNASKVQQEAGDLSALLANASENDIIKLNGDYAGAVAINKNITFDLNGYAINNTLTVSGGNVTIAYSPYGGSANSLQVTGGTATLNGGSFGSLSVGENGTVMQNGATITGAATNNGVLTTTDGAFQGGLTSSNTLTLKGGTFTGANAVTVTGGTAAINRGTITGTAYGVKTTGGATTIAKLAVISGTTKALNGAGGTLTVNNGKFVDPNSLSDGTVVFNAGYFQTNTSGASTVLGKQVWRNTAGAEYRAGYEYFVGDQASAQASNISVCRIGQTAYSSLEEALAFANNSGQEAIIIMENDYTLPAGYYTLPANATLIVPMSNDQQTENQIVPRSTSTPVTPVSFRKLTFASGVNLNVLGTLELTGTQYGAGAEQAIPGGNFGHLILQPGSYVTLGDGAELRAWGFVTGDGTQAADGTYLSGEVDARRGSIVREMFQLADWKGGDVSFTMVAPMEPFTQYQQMSQLFPICTYFIQNVESPVKYHPGASLICAASVNVAGSINAYANDIKIVGVTGEAAMFLMDQMADADNTWVRKWYDANKDQQVYEVNSGAQLGSMVIDLGEVPGAMFDSRLTGMYPIQLDSRKFVLPLTNNMKIHLLSGAMQFTQNTSCLPGMEVEVDKESIITIVKNEDPNVASGSLYFYDSDQWGQYVFNGRYASIVRYSATLDAKPAVRDISSPAALGDAKLIVHGTFQVDENCAVYTTAGKTEDISGYPTVTYTANMSSGGGSIISTNEDAGTFIFMGEALAANGMQVNASTMQPVVDEYGHLNPDVLVNYDNQNGITVTTVMGNNSKVYGFELCTSARLLNGDGSYAVTYTDADNHAVAGDAYCYIEDKWTILKVDEDDGCFMVDNYGMYYVKPQEYVKIVATKDGGVISGNADHTFSDAAGAGRLFILVSPNGECQWWEVEKKDNLYHCIHPNNDTYYYWDEGEEMWMEKKFTITWKNWDGKVIKTRNADNELVENYDVTYGTQAEFFGTNPTREATVDYTYDFAGWSPALDKVTADVTYTATFTTKERKYTIIFLNEGGTEIERQFLTHNAVPACENTPVKTGFTLEWTPAIAAVTGDATYTATWLEEPPTEYEVTFYDYNGTAVLQQGNVAVGSLPTAPANPSGKPATSEYTYVFDHWSPAIEKVSATSAKSYTAVYSEVAKTYTVIFHNEDNSEIERHDYTYGETPVCSATPTKANTAQYTYSFAWTPQIQTVQAAATYKAAFTATTNKYTVSVKSNPSGACAITGAGIYDYNTAEDAVTITLAVNSGYTFTGWSDGQEGTNLSRSMAITADINLTANFTVEDPDYTITWRSEDGSTVLAEVPQKAGTATTYTGATPTKPSTSEYVYTFDGWATEANGEKVYKNNGTPKATADVSYYAHFAQSENVASDMTIAVGETQSISSATTVSQLTLNSNGSASGQLTGADLLTVTGDCNFDLTNGTSSFAAATWYAVAVPWQVIAGQIKADGNSLSWNNGNYLAYYDGSVRAAQGKVDDCWKYVSNGDVLQPGCLYMVYLKNAATTLRFPKKSGASIANVTTTVTAYLESTNNSGKDANWNGIANPATFYAYLNAGSTLADGNQTNYGQVFNPSTQTYVASDMSSAKQIVGQPIFVQAVENKTVTANANSFAAAPARRSAAVSEKVAFRVEIAADDVMQDRLFIHMDENKEADTYTIGQDLVKFGVSSQIAQMWINRYGEKLCVNTMAPVNNAADYPLSISAPKAGEYQISAEQSQRTNEYTLYLTRDGEAIWNLSDAPYTFTLDAGTYANYGLRASAKAPQVATGVDEAVVDAQGETAKKVLINNQVFIIRGDKVYTVDGLLVK